MNIPEDLIGFYRQELRIAERMADSAGLDRKDVCVPFLPFVGSSYADACLKIVFVGKATFGWDMPEIATWHDATAMDTRELFLASQDFINESIIGYYEGSQHPYTSPFWRRIRQITNELNGYSAETKASVSFHGICWTNVFKLGGLHGNPSLSLREFQLTQCRHWLRNELKILDPDLVLFSTGPSYVEYLKLLLSPIENQSTQDINRFKIPSLRSTCYWTRHFQAMSNSQISDFISKIKVDLNLEGATTLKD